MAPLWSRFGWLLGTGHHQSPHCHHLHRTMPLIKGEERTRLFDTWQLKPSYLVKDSSTNLLNYFSIIFLFNLFAKFAALYCGTLTLWYLIRTSFGEVKWMHKCELYVKLLLLLLLLLTLLLFFYVCICILVNFIVRMLQDIKEIYLTKAKHTRLLQMHSLVIKWRSIDYYRAE